MANGRLSRPGEASISNEFWRRDVVDVGRIDLQNVQTGRRSDRVERVERAGRETRVLLLLEDTRRRGGERVFDDDDEQRAFARLGFVRSTAVRPSVWGVFGDVVVVKTSSDAGTIFSVVFATVAFGGVALTLNVKFLGGKIVFLQAMSLIGYCIFPLDASAALCRASSNAVYRLVVVGVGVLWSAAASVPFVSAAVVEERKALAVYPMVLLYVTLGLFAAVVA